MFANKAGSQKPNLQYLWLGVVITHLFLRVTTTTCPEYHSARLSLKETENVLWGWGNVPHHATYFGGIQRIIGYKLGYISRPSDQRYERVQGQLMCLRFRPNRLNATPLQWQCATTCCRASTWGPIDFSWFNAGELWIHDEGSIIHLQHQNHGDFNSLLFQ